MIDRRRARGWHGQLQEYLVSVEARDGEDAVARVLAVLEPHGSFSAFALAGPLRQLTRDVALQ
jgi:acetolactate synthase regulatory subunit